jgi:N-acetylmuramoyl-L-alanine amidase
MIKRIILSIGHGGLPGEKFDPGAVDSKTGAQENTEAKQICSLLAAKLVNAGIPLLFLPDYSYARSIREVNQKYLPGDWAIEIHKDSFTTFNPETMRRRCGTYYDDQSARGKQASDIMLKEFVAAGAHRTSWARKDTLSNHGGLGWNSHTKPLAHIFELGFIQDQNSPGEDEFYAEAAFRAIKAVINSVN